MRLVAIAAVLAALGFLVLTAWLWVNRQRGAGLTLTRLGVGPGGTAAWYLSGLALLSLPAAALGAWLGSLAAGKAAAALSAAVEAGEPPDLRYSGGKLALTRQSVTLAEAEPSPALPWLAAGAALLLLLLLALFFALRTRPRSGRRARADGQGRGRFLTSSLRGGAAKYALLSIGRGGFRSLVGLAAPLAAALLLTVLAASLTDYRAELATLETESAVRGYFTDLYGRKVQGLLLNDEDVEALAALDGCVASAKTAALERFVYVGKGDGEGGLLVEKAPKLPMSELGVSLAKQDYEDAPRIVLTTQLEMAPQFLYSAAPEITVWQGEAPEPDPEDDPRYYMNRETEWGLFMEPEIYESLLKEGGMEAVEERICQNASPLWKYNLLPNYCAVSTAFMEEHGLSLGDDFLIAGDPEGEAFLERWLALEAEYRKPLWPDG